MFDIREWNGIIDSLRSMFSDDELFGENTGLHVTLDVERRFGASEHEVIISPEFGGQVEIQDTVVSYAAQYEMVDVIDGSYINWMKTQNLVILDAESGHSEVRLRSLSSIPEGSLDLFEERYRKTKLKRLSELWKFQRGRAALQEHTFAFLQTGLTGVTFLYVVGVGVFSVACYLCFYIHHLRNIARDNVLYLKYFAFMPTTLPNMIWAMELFFRVSILPGLALLGTTIKFPPFQLQWLSWLLFSFLTIVFLLIGVLDCLGVRRIRRWIPDAFFLRRGDQRVFHYKRSTVRTLVMRGSVWFFGGYWS